MRDADPASFSFQNRVKAEDRREKQSSLVNKEIKRKREKVEIYLPFYQFTTSPLRYFAISPPF